MPRIFVSYRRKDSAGHAGRLFDRLRDHFGAASVFRDVDQLKAGDDFVEALARAVDSCNVFILVIGRDWVDARNERGERRLEDPEDFIRLEVETALRRKVLVLPVLVEGAAMPDPASLPEPLRPLARRQAIELSEHRWDFDVQELVRRIEEVGGKRRVWTSVPFRAAAAALVLALAGAATSRMWWPLWMNAARPPAISTSPPPASPVQTPGQTAAVEPVPTKRPDERRPASSPPARATSEPSPPMKSTPPAQSPHAQSAAAQVPAQSPPVKPPQSATSPAVPASPPAAAAEPAPEKPPQVESPKTKDPVPSGGGAPPVVRPPEPAPENAPPAKPADTQVRVPDMTGQGVRDAAMSLRDLALRAKVESRSTGRAAPGTVYGQRPAAGTLVERGGVVQLYVSATLKPNERAAGSVYLSPGRMIDVDGDSEGLVGWDVSFDGTGDQFFLSFGKGAQGALLPIPPGGPSSLDPAMCERIRTSDDRLPISDRTSGQMVCVRTTAGRTAAIFLGRLTPDPPELFIRYSTLEAPRAEAGGPIASPDAPARPPLYPMRPPSPAASCEQAVQGKIDWDYSGTRTWDPLNVRRLCRGAVDDQPARCFDRVMHGGIDWGGGTRWESQGAMALCEGTRNADTTIACFQRYISQRRSMREAIAACSGRPSR
jgi:TIR domain/PASTA domain